MKQIKNWRKGTVCDIETDGLLEELTKCHVVSLQMFNKSSPVSINGEDLDRIKKMLVWHIENEIPIVGHNFILFDVPALEKLTGLDLSCLMVIDTLALSWYLNTSRQQHGLDSFLDDYGIKKPEIKDWSNLSYEQYSHRCREDVKINKALWDDFQERLLTLYTQAKEAIDNGLVGGKRLNSDEKIYIDTLKGLTIDQHIERFLSFLMFKIDTYRIQEKVGILLDKDHLETNENIFKGKIDELKTKLESVMPKIPKYSKKKKPKELYKKNGEFSLAGKNWEQIKQWFNNEEKDEFGTKKVLLGKDEPTILVDGEYRCRQTDDIEEFLVLSSYEEPNANSPDQIKNFLYSYGWIPETFKEVKDKEADQAWQNEMKKWRETKGKRGPKPERPIPRQVPQVTISGDNGKELCPSVEKLAERVPEIAVYSNLNLFKHRHGVLKGLLESMDSSGRIKATIGGLTNTLRAKHRNVVNLVGIDKIGGKEIRGAFIAEDSNILVGSDMSSLEDRTKHHFMLPHDPKYVETMMQEDYDPHLMMAVTARFITEREMNDYKIGLKPEHVTKGRKLGKSCLPVDNTQIFTRGGWKWFDEIEIGEDVLSLNEEKEQVWCKVKDKIFYPNQPVKTLSHKSWCIESTGNHRWLVNKRIRTKSNPRYKTIYAETDQLVEDMNILTTGVYNSGRSNVTPNQASIVGWLLGDGYLFVSDLTGKTSQGKNGHRQYVRFTISQSPKKYLDEIRELLQHEGLSYREDLVTSSNNGETVNLTVSAKEARNFLKSLGLPLCGKHEIDYTTWILGLSKEAREAFLLAFWKADGWTSPLAKTKKSKVYFQNRGKVFDAIHLAIHLCGKNVIVAERKNGYATLVEQVRSHITCQNLKKIETRETDVFCLTTENGNFLIKQGDTITITGNCNYSAVYGAGAPKIAATAGVDEKTGKLLHESYWTLNWSVQAIAEEQYLVEIEPNENNSAHHKLWLVNPINGFMYAIRAKKDVFSTLCQGTGSFFFDMWLKHVLRRQKEKYNLTKIQLQMHDEIMFSFKDTDKFKNQIKDLIKCAIKDVNEEFFLRRKLDVDVQFGKKYSEIH